jgi:hypothetical protein
MEKTKAKEFEEKLRKLRGNLSRNKEVTYKIIIKDTKEVVSEFRTKYAANYALPRLRKIYISQLEIQKI